MFSQSEKVSPVGESVFSRSGDISPAGEALFTALLPDILFSEEGVCLILCR